MTSLHETHGERIQSILAEATDTVHIIAPYIKLEALRFLVNVIPPQTHIRCTTRWLSREVAAGVSDPSIIYLLEQRGNFSLTLVDNLHAKIYIADGICLAGSPNVTLKGLGEIEDENIEILVETTTSEPNIIQVLSEIESSERSATKELAESIMNLAKSIPAAKNISDESQLIFETESRNFWFPRSNKPELAYHFYSKIKDSTPSKIADQVLIMDVATANVSPGLSRDEFYNFIRSRLATISIAKTVLDSRVDTTLSFDSAHSYLEAIVNSYFPDFDTRDLWRAFVSWMSHYYSDEVIEQYISEIALRRAQLLA